MTVTNLRVLSAALLCIMAAGSGRLVEAAPQGGTVVAGQGSIRQPDAATTVVTQASPSLVIDWNSFNVGAAEQVRFSQPNTTAAVLNRIGDAQPSQIDGILNANGRVFLINPNGLIFGNSAVVNVGSLIAGALGISTEDFMHGDYHFSAPPGEEGGRVINHGLLSAAAGGSVSLFGGSVANDGLIIADYGRVGLGAGRKAWLDFDGDGLLRFEVQGSVLDNAQGVSDAVSNSGRILALGGQVLLTADAAKDVFTRAVNNSGVIEAVGVDKRGGVVRLVGSGGAVSNNGTLDASSSDGKGGDIDVLGDQVALGSNARVDASGQNGGGNIRIGGDFHGSNPDIQNAQHTVVAAGSEISANAVANGDGGKVAVSSDGATEFYGHISAQGGAESGNGGVVEVSGKHSLTYAGQVDTRAPNGMVGSLLLDPDEMIIDNTTDQFVTSTGTDPVIFSATTPPSHITWATIDSQLATTGVTIQTSTNDITVAASSAGVLGTNAINGTTLLLDSAAAININADIISSVATNITFNALSGINLAANVTSARGHIQFSNATTLTAAAPTVSAGAGGIGFSSTIDGGTNSLTTNNTGSLTFGGAISNMANLTIQGGPTAVALPQTTLTGALAVRAGGPITQSGALSVAGTSSFNAGVNAITLTDVGNDFTGLVTATGNTIQLNDANVLTAVLTDSGTSTVTAGGNLAVSGTVTGTLNTTTTGTTSYGTTTAGALNASSAGAVSQTGSITAGAATIGAGANTITLTDVGNDFTGLVTATGNTIQLNDTNALTAALTDSGTSTVTAGGNLAVSGSVTGTLNTTTTGTMSYGTTTAGALNASSAGAVSQTGSITTGAATIGAGANAITLTNAANDFTGAVSLSNSGANAVAVTDANTLDVGTSTVGDSLTLSGNAVTLNGAIDGVTSLVFNSVSAVSGTGTVTGTGTSSVLGITDFDAMALQSHHVTYSGFNTISGVGTLSNITKYDLVTGSDGSVTYSGFLTLVGAGGGSRMLSSGTAWNISGADSGTVDGYTFSNFANVTGTGGADSFVFADGGSLSGSLDGGSGNDTLDLSAKTSAVGIDQQTATTSGIGGTFSNIEAVIGNGVNSTLTGLDAGETFSVTGPDGGTVGTLVFSNIGNLTGGLGDDSFVIAGTGSLTGRVDGGGQITSDTLDYSAVTPAVTAKIGTNFINIEKVTGDGVNDTLVGANTANSWTISGANSGTVGSVAFSGFGNLTGGMDDDHFVVGAGGAITGKLNGNGGTDTLDYSSFSGPVVVNLDGGSPAGVSNVENLLGGSGSNTLIGPNANSVWTINQNNGGKVSYSQLVNFSGFQTLTGGSGADRFELGADFSGSVDGGAGTDTIDITGQVHTSHLTLNADEVDFTVPGQIDAGGGAVRITADAVNANEKGVQFIADTLALHAADHAGTYNLPIGLIIGTATDFGTGSRNFVTGIFGDTHGEFTDVGNTTLNVYRGQSAVVQGRGRIDPALFIKGFNLFSLIGNGVRLPPDQREE